MLQSIKELEGRRLGASDGEIGHVKDFYFDDQTWAVRYVVADTGAWLPGRKVLISPYAFGSLHQAGKILSVNLTRKQIENCPSIDTHKPLSRQYEEEYYRYYGWPLYWEGGGVWGMTSVPLLEVAPNSLTNGPVTAKNSQSAIGDAHLRSAQAVNGYQIQASDKTIGHVCDFIMDGQSWALSHLVVKTGNRFSGKQVRIPVGKVERVSYDKSTVLVNLTGEAIEQIPESELVAAGVD